MSAESSLPRQCKLRCVLCDRETLCKSCAKTFEVDRYRYPTMTERRWRSPSFSITRLPDRSTQPDPERSGGARFGGTGSGNKPIQELGRS